MTVPNVLKWGLCISLTAFLLWMIAGFCPLNADDQPDSSATTAQQEGQADSLADTLYGSPGEPAAEDTTETCLFGIRKKWKAGGKDVFGWLVTVSVIVPSVILAVLSLVSNNRRFFWLVMGWPSKWRLGYVLGFDVTAIAAVFAVLLLFLAVVLNIICASTMGFVEALALVSSLGTFYSITIAMAFRIVKVMRYKPLVEEKQLGRQRQPLPKNRGNSDDKTN